MADSIQTLNENLNKLIDKLGPLTDFATQWKLREQQPGLYSKLPVAVPFRPNTNRCEILALGLADVFTRSLDGGLYDVTADADCFIALNAIARVDGGYPIRAGLVYGPMRIATHDIIHAITAVAPVAGSNIYFCPVE